MTDFKELQFNDSKDAVRSIYHTLMEIVEGYCERACNFNLDDEFIDVLRKKYYLAIDMLKYNMLEIPAYTYGMLYSFCEKNILTLLGENWADEQKANYNAYLKGKGIKEDAGDEWSNINGWCKMLKDSFYDAMSMACRNVFETQLIKDSKLKKLFLGD